MSSPPKDEFLELPAGKSFMTELANNRAFTTLSYDGPEEGCLMDGGDGSGGELHTKNIESTGGTAWAISYESNIRRVAMDNLIVFSVRYYSPFFRETCYGFLTASNMYMQNHRCKVTGSASTKKLGKTKPPVYCRDNPTECVPGPKQMMAWNQAEGNNANPPNGKTPTYNQRMGFLDGAQDDIFLDEKSEAKC
ncbi:proteophosphoglycan ppg4 [Fusarium heterosporum]|uniref:Proteophosphoglycan ppg4 n=1 Tax=Fusarium heterosporum TaxID=42747 RepID=A0A8H5TP63_FUSHE|nr:proteophosphoglycan ppg4 [Fusarium heterosporum]